MYSLYHFCTRKYGNPVLHVRNYCSNFLPQGHKASTCDMPQGHKASTCDMPQGHKASTCDMPQGHKSSHIRFAPWLMPHGHNPSTRIMPLVHKVCFFIKSIQSERKSYISNF
jgi:hypothetical protein